MGKQLSQGACLLLAWEAAWQSLGGIWREQRGGGDPGWPEWDCGHGSGRGRKGWVILGGGGRKGRCGEGGIEESKFAVSVDRLTHGIGLGGQGTGCLCRRWESPVAVKMLSTLCWDPRP